MDEVQGTSPPGKQHEQRPRDICEDAEKRSRTRQRDWKCHVFYFVVRRQTGDIIKGGPNNRRAGAVGAASDGGRMLLLPAQEMASWKPCCTVISLYSPCEDHSIPN